MTLALTTPITINNIQKIHVASVFLDGDNNLANIICVVTVSGGLQFGQPLQITVRDGQSSGIRAKAVPLSATDVVEVFALTTPTGFTDLVTAYTGSINVRNKAAETALIASGCIPAGVVS